MYLGRVVGSVWATAKNASLEGRRLALVQPVTPDLKPSGRALVCTDATGARAGDVVYYCGGKEASMAFLPAEACTDRTIVGIVDQLSLGRES
jgi:ethanolamine utilization protein EutN